MPEMLDRFFYGALFGFAFALLLGFLWGIFQDEGKKTKAPAKPMNTSQSTSKTPQQILREAFIASLKRLIIFPILIGVLLLGLYIFIYFFQMMMGR